MADGLDSFLNLLIRPDRDVYDPDVLGPTSFSLPRADGTFERNDFELESSKGNLLQCSLWSTQGASVATCPCVVYLHSNTGSRVDAIPLLPFLLPLNITVCALDFAGCGRSEGEYIRCGPTEGADATLLVQHLHSTYGVSNLVLWGRDLGAVAAIYAGKALKAEALVAGIIFDSPYSDLKLLATEYATNAERLGLPSLVLKLALKLLSRDMHKLTGVRMGNVRPIDQVKGLEVPALFVHGLSDILKPHHHSDDLAAKYDGQHEVIKCEGQHNTPRPGPVVDQQLAFVCKCLQAPRLPAFDGGLSSKGYRSFLVERIVTPPDRSHSHLCVLLISPAGVRISAPNDTHITQGIPLQRMKAWTANSIVLRVEWIDDSKTVEVWRFRTAEGPTIIEFLNKAVAAVQKRASMETLPVATVAPSSTAASSSSSSSSKDKKKKKKSSKSGKK